MNIAYGIVEIREKDDGFKKFEDVREAHPLGPLPRVIARLGSRSSEEAANIASCRKRWRRRWQILRRYRE